MCYRLKEVTNEGLESTQRIVSCPSGALVVKKNIADLKEVDECSATNGLVKQPSGSVTGNFGLATALHSGFFVDTTAKERICNQEWTLPENSRRKAGIN